MVTLSKAEALKRFPKSNKQYGYVCPFHRANPSQEAVMYSCKKCVFVQDPCGCGFDEECVTCTREEIICDIMGCRCQKEDCPYNYNYLECSKVVFGG